MAAENEDLIFKMNLDVDIAQWEKTWKTHEATIQASINKTPFKIKLNVDTDAVMKAVNALNSLNMAGAGLSGSGKQSTPAQMVVAQARAAKIELDAKTASTVRMMAAEVDAAKKALDLEAAEKRLAAATRQSEVADLSKEVALKKKAAAEAQAVVASNKAVTSEVNKAKAMEQSRQAIIKTERAQLGLERAQQRGISATHTQNKAYQNQRGIMNGLPQMMNSYISILGAYRLGSNIVSVTAEFEMQRVALAAIIQDKPKADKLFSQMIELGLQSPFQIKELVTYTKELAAYRVETEDLYETTKRLADISAGLGVDMSRLILAYGQVKAASVLRGQELRQFTEAGIPLVSLLADKFSILKGEMVDTGEVFKLISQRAVPFSMVKEIFDDMTDAGGMFYKMQEIQSRTLKGSLSNLRDAYDKMFMQMGNSQMSLLKGGIDMTKTMASNWETIVRVIQNGILAYGAYKFAIAGVTVMLGKENKQMLDTLRVDKLREAERLRQISLSRALTVEEQKVLMYSRAITLADWQQLAASGALNKDTALRMIALGKMTVFQAQSIAATLGLTEAEIASAAATSRTKLAFMSASAGIRMFASSVRAAAVALLSSPITWIVLGLAAVGKAYSMVADRQKYYKELTEATRKSTMDYGNEMKDAYEKISAVVNAGIDADPGSKDEFSAVKALQGVIEKNEELKPLVEERLSRLDSEAEKLLKLLDIWDEIKAATEDSASGSELFSMAQKGTGGLFDADIVKNAYKLNDAISSISTQMLDMATKDKIWTTGLKNHLTGLTDGLKSGSMTVDQFRAGLNSMVFEVLASMKKIGELRDNARVEDKPKYQDQIETYRRLATSINKASERVEILQKDEKVFFDAMWSGLKLSYPKLDQFAKKFGLSDVDFDAVQTKLNVWKGMWLRSLTEVEKAGAPILNNLFGQHTGIPWRPGVNVPELTTFEKAYNKFLSDKKISVTPALKAGVENQNEDDLLKSTTESLKEKASVLELYNNQIKAGNKLNEGKVKGLTKEILQLEVLARWLGYAEKTKKESKAAVAADPRIKALSQEVQLIEEAQKKYQEYLGWMSAAEAKAKVQNEYGGQVKALPLAFSQAEMDAMYATAIASYKKMRDAGDEVFKTQLKRNDSNFDDYIRNMKANLDRMGNDIQQYEKANDFYEKMLGLNMPADMAERMTKAMGFTIGNVREKMQETLKMAMTGHTTGLDMTNFADVQKAVNKMPEETRKLAQDQLDAIISYEQKALEALYGNLDGYQSYEDKKLEIIRTYNKRMADIAANPKLKPEERVVLEKREKATMTGGIANLDFEKLKGLDSYVQAFEDLDRVGGATLSNLRRDLEKLAKTSGTTAADMKAIADQIQKIKDIQESSDPMSMITSGLKEYREALLDLDLYGAQTDSEEYAAAQNRLRAAIDKSADGAKKLESNFQAIDDVATKSIDFLEQFADALGLTFSDETMEYINAFKQGFTLVSAALGLYSSAMALAKVATDAETISVTALMTAMWPLLAAAAVLGLVFAGIKAIGNWVNKEAEDRLAAQTEKLDALTLALERLQRAQDKVVGSDYIKNVKDQIAVLEKQAAIQKEQADTERNKKTHWGVNGSIWSTDTRSTTDKEKLKEYEKAYQATLDAIEDANDAFLSEMAGTDLASAAKDFATAWLDAYNSFGNTMDAMGVKFKDMINTMVTNAALSKIVFAKMKPVFDQIELMFSADGPGKEDATAAELANLQNLMATILPGLDATLKAAMAGLEKSGVVTKQGQAALTGISKSVGSMSEDAADTMGAYLNSGLMQWIKQTSLQQQLVDMMRDGQGASGKYTLTDLYGIQNQALSELRAINSNTGRNADAAEKLVETMSKLVRASGGQSMSVKLT